MATKKARPKKASGGLSNQNCIGAFLHCGLCLDDLPEGTSPRDWAQLEVGWTREGLQVWCKRHEVNVVHIDFQGQKHPANTTAHVEGNHVAHH